MQINPFIEKYIEDRIATVFEGYTELQEKNDELERRLKVLEDRPIVSADANNDLTVGSDNSPYFQETI